VRPPVSVIDPVLPMVLPTELVAVWGWAFRLSSTPDMTCR
jgi:hypothetical protein